MRFEVVSLSVRPDHNRERQWRMLGTNTGPLPGGPATGGTLDLPGADLFTYDAAPTASAGSWATSTPAMLGQLGLQAHITPGDIEGA